MKKKYESFKLFKKNKLTNLVRLEGDDLTACRRTQDLEGREHSVPEVTKKNIFVFYL